MSIIGKINRFILEAIVALKMSLFILVVYSLNLINSRGLISNFFRTKISF